MICLDPDLGLILRFQLEYLQIHVPLKDCSREDFFVTLGISITLNYWILLGLLRVWQGLFQELISKVLNTLCVWYSGDFFRYIPGTTLEASYCNLWGKIFLSLGISRTSWCWSNSSADMNEKSTESVDQFSILYCERCGMSLRKRLINILLTPCYRLECCT